MATNHVAHGNCTKFPSRAKAVNYKNVEQQHGIVKKSSVMLNPLNQTRVKNILENDTEGEPEMTQLPLNCHVEGLSVGNASVPADPNYLHFFFATILLTNICNNRHTYIQRVTNMDVTKYWCW